MTKICSLPWNTVVIDHNGNIFSCLCGGWTNNKTIGNILQTPLTEIYKSSKSLIEIRNSILDNSYLYCNSYMCPNIHRIQDSHSSIEKNSLIEHVLPTEIMLSIDYNCNLRCPSCRSYSIFSKSVDPTAQRILDNLTHMYINNNQTCTIYCDGLGDVFASLAYEKFLFSGNLPDCFKLVITTNGNLIKNKISNILNIKNQIDLFIVSLDAATPETYSKTRGGNFNKVIEGVKLLLQNNIKVKFQYVLQYENYQELSKYQELSNSLGIDFGVQLIEKRPHMSESYWNYSKIQDNPKVDYQLLKNYLQRLLEDRTCDLNGGIYTLIKDFGKWHNW